MDAQEYVRRRWEEADALEGELLHRLNGSRDDLTDELQVILDRFARLELSGNLPKKEAEALHRAIRRWREAGLADIRPLRLYLNDLENRSRIRGEEALFLWLFSTFALYYRRVEAESVQTLGKIAKVTYDRAYEEAPWGREQYRPPDEAAVKRLLEEPLPDGGRFSDGLYADAQYRARQTAKLTAQRKAQDVTLDLAGADYQKALRAQEACMLRPSPNRALPDKHAGYIDMVMAFIVGQTVAQAFRDRGVKRYQFIATVDERTTDECRALHLRVFDMEELKLGINAPPVYPPPHPCRSIIRAVQNDEENAIIEFREITLFRGERNLIGRTKETAIVYDGNGNELFRKYGEVGKVRMSGDERSMLIGNILSHNHPSGGPPSPNDLFALWKSELKELRTLTQKGVYSMRPPKQWKRVPESPSAVVREFWDIYGTPGDALDSEKAVVAMRTLSARYGVELEYEEWN